MYWRSKAAVEATLFHCTSLKQQLSIAFVRHWESLRVVQTYPNDTVRFHKKESTVLSLAPMGWYFVSFKREGRRDIHHISTPSAENSNVVRFTLLTAVLSRIPKVLKHTMTMTSFICYENICAPIFLYSFGWIRQGFQHGRSMVLTHGIINTTSRSYTFSFRA